MTLTTRKMSAKHEDYLAERLEGTRTKNSGAVWSDQGDGHHLGSEEHWRFGWDGKSTLGKSIGITRDMLAKLRQQCRGLEPAIPLRFYADERLVTVDEDWVAIELETFAQMREEANRFRAMLDAGCASGTHDDETFEERGMGGIPKCKACGLYPYERGNE